LIGHETARNQTQMPESTDHRITALEEWRKATEENYARLRQDVDGLTKGLNDLKVAVAEGFATVKTQLRFWVTIATIAASVVASVLAFATSYLSRSLTARTSVERMFWNEDSFILPLRQVATVTIYVDGIGMAPSQGAEVLAMADGILSSREEDTIVLSLHQGSPAVANPGKAFPKDRSGKDELVFTLTGGATFSQGTKARTSASIRCGDQIASINGRKGTLVVKRIKDGVHTPPQVGFANPKIQRRYENGEPQAIFFAHCVRCHNPNASGNPIGPPALKSLNTRSKFRNGLPVNLENVLNALIQGSSGMPSFKDTLAPHQLQELAKYVLTF